MTGASGVRRVCVVSLTMQQDDGLLERQRVPDLQLAVGTLQHVGGKKEHEGRRSLNALEHALLGEVGGPVVVPHLRKTKSGQRHL